MTARQDKERDQPPHMSALEKVYGFPREPQQAGVVPDWEKRVVRFKALSPRLKQVYLSRSVMPVIVQSPQLNRLKKIAMLGNHLPRQCGIATFTTDLSDAICARYPTLECSVLAMNEEGRHHAYPHQVGFEIDANDIASYRRATDFIDVGSFDLVSVQHEYGIFGGEAGSYVLELLEGLHVPIVTTLHTILAEPEPQQRQTLNAIIRLSDRVVVMSVDGARLLREVHDVSEAKIDVIPHGIPSLPSAKESKDRLGVNGKTMILTFGLLTPDKGIEHVIDALPTILERHPNTVYFVVGATHPHVKDREGETYRAMLKARAKSNAVDSNVIFHERFVSIGELTEFLAGADIYITPYLNSDQITSGTLAYAVGSGKAVISTPYPYARELLANGRGVLVPRANPEAIAHEVIGLLDNELRAHAIRGRAITYGRDMIWSNVAHSYVQSFKRASSKHDVLHRESSRVSALKGRSQELPEVNLQHLERLSDHTGILQHAIFTVPRYGEGYCLDDNARALLLATLLEPMVDKKTVGTLASRSLAFVAHSFERKGGRFRNFMSYSRRWIEEHGSEDSHGRALWALGTVVGRSEDVGRRSLAHSLFHDAIPLCESFTSPRSWAYTLLGIDEYLVAFRGERGIQTFREHLAERLYQLFLRTSDQVWPWFEEQATYCNARLSQALFLSGWRMEREEMKEAGLRSLSWLSEIQLSSGDNGFFTPIGTNGFYERGGSKAAFDQQPVEACSMISASLSALQVTGEERWAVNARRVFDWFLGHNELGQSLYDAETGGCRDGLHSERPNENQGAESTISFLLALVEMHSAVRSAFQLIGNDGSTWNSRRTAP